MKHWNAAFIVSFLFIALSSKGAVPQQTFKDCFGSTVSPTLSVENYKALSKMSKQTHCQNLSSKFAKADLLELLQNRTDVGISVEGTNFSKDDLVEMAKAGQLTVIADSRRLNRGHLLEIAKAGASLAVVSAAGFSKEDLIALSQETPYILAVNTSIAKEDLIQLVKNKTQLIVYLFSSGVRTSEMMEIMQTNPDLVSLKP